MTAARKLAPPAPPRSHPELPPRRYDLDVEIIPTACGRIVERRKVDARSHRYRLFEPVLQSSRYSVEHRDSKGAWWGVAHTRRPTAEGLRYDAQVDHLLAEQRRVVDILRRTVIELGLHDDQGRPAGVADAVYEDRGDILLFTDPEVRAGLVRSQRSTGARGGR